MSTEDKNIQHEGQKEVEGAGTIKFTRRSFYTALLPVTFVTGLAAGYLFWGRDTVPPANPAAPVAIVEETTPESPEDQHGRRSIARSRGRADHNRRVQ